MDLSQHPAVRRSVLGALQEDVGRGDVTTRVALAPALQGSAVILAETDCVVAGVFLVPLVYERCDPRLNVEVLVSDGVPLTPGTPVARMRGPIASVLAGERVALNFVQHLSGVATLTRRFVDAVRGTTAAIVDTRKTVPGLRVLQKYAVHLGGGVNHRFGLDDGILIKNTHVALGGGTAAVVTRARRAAPLGLRVQVECRSRAEVEAALAAGADALLLDNQTVDEVRALVRMVDGRLPVEVSGGITLESVRAYAETGVDRISIGALTHSASAVSLHLRVETTA